MNYLSILAIMKNEAMNLKIWIDHYISQGVGHFYLIDNGSDDESVNIINDLIKNNYPITLHILLEKYVQVKHYRYVYDQENLKKATKWLIVADLDEFFYCKNSKTCSWYVTKTIFTAFWSRIKKKTFMYK